MNNLAGSLTGISVLIVEDTSKSSRALFRTILEFCGATVLTAHSAPAAKNILAVFRPKVIVTDLTMPGDGLEVLRYIRGEADKRGVTTPAVAVTPYRDLRDDALRAGAAAFLSEPVGPFRLCSAVRQALHLSA
jgi:CheY-like chemotaxis protein